MRSLAVLATLALTGAAAAQPLYAVSFTGQFYQLNTTTGASSLIGGTGFPRLNSAAMNSAGEVFTTHIRDTSISTDTNQLLKISTTTGVATSVLDFGTAHDIRGLAFADGDILYGIEDNSQLDSLISINLATGIVTSIGPTGRSDLQGLTAAPGGVLYAVGITSPGQVFTINTTTGAATLVGGSVGTDNQALEYAGNNTAWSARANLVSVDLTTGVTTFIGSTGLTDIRGLASFRPTGGGCYANCDNSTASPVLNALDFGCFLTKFAAGDPYANCDNSTAAPVLNALDFGCFLTKFAAGCT